MLRFGLPTVLRTVPSVPTSAGMMAGSMVPVPSMLTVTAARYSASGSLTANHQQFVKLNRGPITRYSGLLIYYLENKGKYSSVTVRDKMNLFHRVKTDFDAMNIDQLRKYFASSDKMQAFLDKKTALMTPAVKAKKVAKVKKLIAKAKGKKVAKVKKANTNKPADSKSKKPHSNGNKGKKTVLKKGSKGKKVGGAKKQKGKK